MKRNIQLVFAICMSCLLLASCKKDKYRNDGGRSVGEVNMTTYDWLKSNPNHLFDSLVYMIDRAGLKDAINGNITFFATTDFGNVEFMKARKYANGIITGDENLPYTIDSIPSQELADSLKMYIMPSGLTRSTIKLSGTLYDCPLGPIPGVQWLVKLQRTQADYVDHIDYIQFGKVNGTRDDLEPNPDAIPQEEKDVIVTCQTTDIKTTTGIVHVLDGNHRLFFNAGRTN